MTMLELLLLYKIGTLPRETTHNVLPRRFRISVLIRFIYVLNLKPPLQLMTEPVVYAASGVQSIAMTPAVSDSYA